MMDAPQNIIILGDPAAGKSTQAGRIVKRYGLYDFDMGHELRRRAKDPRIMKKYRLAKTLHEGRMTPTALARRIILEALRTVPATQGILFDGHPKMLGEAEFLDRELRKRKRSDPIAIYLRIPLREMHVRTRRRGRSDDSALAIRNRLKYYRRNVRAAVAFYRKRYVFKAISGLGTRDEVFHRIRAFVDHAMKRDAKNS